MCTFCGAQLAMSYNEQSQTNQSQTPPLPVPATPTQDPPALQATASSQVITSRVENPDETKEADAVAFKDRLVGYDRNAAQRTKVIDDQSDYFEIDSNTWLSQQVQLIVHAWQTTVLHTLFAWLHIWAALCLLISFSINCRSTD